MDNQTIANALEDIAKIKKALSSNRFSVGAYSKAAKFIANLSVPIKSIDLNNTKGIGPKIAASIIELLDTGKIQYIVDNSRFLQSDSKIEELLKVEGIGEKTALLIYRQLNISTVAQLKKAVEDGSISQVFKDKTIEKIKRGIEYLETTKGRIRLDEGLFLALKFHQYLKPFVKKMEFCGSVRRSKETVGDLDFAVVAKDGVDVLRKFEQFELVNKVIDSGDKKSSVWVNGVRVDCYVFTPDLYESGVMHLTGNDEHNKRMRVLAIAKGWILSQYGLYRRGPDDEKIGDRLDDGTEKGIYNLLGLHWIPPEHREGNIEFDEYKLDKELPIIVESSDILYDFHVHSTWSDGVSSIEECVQTAMKNGLKGIAICDHSQSLKIAKGLTVERLQQKLEEVRQLRKKYPNFKILMGSEVDIKSDGTLDYPNEILNQLDIVVASIHTATKKDVTDLYKKAISTGKVDIIGHLTGRMINERAGLEMNVEEVLQECAVTGVAIELNCQPNRLDANDVILKRCKTLGIKVALGSDAHEKNQISYVKTFGSWIAKRAWLSKEDLFVKEML